MKRVANAGFVVLCFALLLFLALFPLLTIDAVSLLLSRAALLDRGNLALLLYLELSRGITTVVAIVVAAWLVARAARTADGRALAVFLIFSALTFEKIFGTTPYPGPIQQWLVATLKDAGVSRATLAWVFGPMPWSLWPAWAAALRFSVVFTTPPLSAALIDESGTRDRRGILRGSALAGADIGQAFRAMAKGALAAGAFRPLPLWLGAFVLIAITTLLSGIARTLLVVILSVMAVALVITNLRAAYLAAGEYEQRRMRWLVLGFVVAGVIMLIAALPLLFFNEPLAQVPALVLLMLAPAAIIIGLAMAVLYRGGGDARHLLRRLPTFSALVLALLLVFALMVTFLRAFADRGAIARPWTLAVALIVTAALFPVLRALVNSAVDYVLERRAG